MWHAASAREHTATQANIESDRESTATGANPILPDQAQTQIGRSARKREQHPHDSAALASHVPFLMG